MLKPYQKKMLDSLVRQEQLLCKLYSLFAAQFPQHAELWNTLAKEEHKHASWLQQLHEAADKGVVLFQEGKIKTYTVSSFIEYVEQILAKAEDNQLTLSHAVAATVDLERSLLEKNIFNHFDGMTEKARSVLKQLAKETEIHLARAQAVKDAIG